jgi:predicted lipoprotein with Yx(FWY)xxD motif
MGFSPRRAYGLSWTARVAVAAVVLGGSAAATVGIATASAAQARPSHVATSATVVKVATRAPFGKILTRTNGLSLYIHPGGPCNASCQTIWPPLVMPAGTTTPLGAKCLATAALGTKLQVTYHGQRLFSFSGDSGSSVNGNGVAGFKVAKVTTACP